MEPLTRSNACTQVGAEYAASILEQERQLEALKTMGDALSHIAKNTNISFEGVSMQVYHPLVRRKTQEEQTPAR